MAKRSKKKKPRRRPAVGKSSVERAAPATQPEREEAPKPAPPAPGRLQFGRAVGSAALSALVLVVLSGVFLLLGYEGGRAHDSMKDLIAVTPLGVVMRAVHYLGAYLLLAALGVLVLRSALGRNRPKAGAHLLTVSLLLVATTLTCTGEALPWDHAGRETARAATSLGAGVPLVSSVQSMLRGGPKVGKATLKRFHYLHVLPLPLPLLGLVLLIARLRRPREPDGSAAPRPPPLLERPELAVALLTAVLLIVVALAWPAAHLGGAGDGPGNLAPAKAPWYLVGWQEVGSYSQPIGLLFMLAVLLVIVAPPWIRGTEPDDAPAPSRTWAIGAMVLGVAVAATAVWWWRDPSYGAPALLNPASFVLVAAVVGGVVGWRLKGSGLAHRVATGLLIGAMVLFAFVGWFVRGPSWALTWHPGQGALQPRAVSPRDPGAPATRERPVTRGPQSVRMPAAEATTRAGRAP